MLDIDEATNTNLIGAAGHEARVCRNLSKKEWISISYARARIFGVRLAMSAIIADRSNSFADWLLVPFLLSLLTTVTRLPKPIVAGSNPVTRFEFRGCDKWCVANAPS